MPCNHLITIKNPQTGEHLQVPCGHCVGCLIDMQTEWATRMTMELKSDLSRPAVFVTLTYNDDNLPTEEFNEKTGEVFQQPSVNKKHVQQFMKSLRTKIERQKKRGVWKGYSGPLKYFFASEYGPTHGRPHYHGIIYGLTKNDGDLINEVWNKGFTYFGEANEKTIMYCAKYCVKPVEFTQNPHRRGYFDNERWMEDNGIRRKPFRLMSTKLGANYCDNPSNIKFHFRDIFKNNYLRVGKIKKKLPRYFKNKIYTEENFNKYCRTNASKLAFLKMKNNTLKYDKKYGSNNITYNLVNLIGRAQYYRHLSDKLKDYAISEDNIQRDIQDANEKERLLIKNREKWMRRAGRYHKQ